MEQNAFLKKQVLSILLNTSTLLALRISAGRLFHSVGAATSNERSPSEQTWKLEMYSCSLLCHFHQAGIFIWE